MRLARIFIGIVIVTCIVCALSHVPYDVLRVERYRLFGEIRTTGRVTAVHTETSAGDGVRFFIDYKYIDSDGLVRTASARLEQAQWRRFRPGGRLVVLYARSRPGLARVPGEVEPAFQRWLRRMLN